VLVHGDMEEPLAWRLEGDAYEPSSDDEAGGSDGEDVSRGLRWHSGQPACLHTTTGRNQTVLSPGCTMYADATQHAAGSCANSVPPWPLQGEADEAAGRSYPLTAVSKAIEAQMGCSVESAALQVRALRHTPCLLHRPQSRMQTAIAA
jgi:hypothetical protein